MKRIGWIRTHDQSNRKTIFIRPFGQVLRTTQIKTFLLFPNISKNVNLNSGDLTRFKPTTDLINVRMTQTKALKKQPMRSVGNNLYRILSKKPMRPVR